MTEYLSEESYKKAISLTRDSRMKKWREARFGMFIHYGLYSLLGRNEWVQVLENIPREEYARLAESFAPGKDICRKWAEQAKRAGMKYMVLTTRHHEGFSLWNSRVNPFNSYNYCGRDIVKEFTEACREAGLGIGFYTSLMDWHHEDGWKCAVDSEARGRFLSYIEELNTELLTNYGKIDILWYDMPEPMKHYEGWNSLERNQKLRKLQPDIIINNRSRLPEDFGTPEEEIKEGEEDWEACMTFNGISWGYVDSAQAEAYSYNAQGIIKMLNSVAKGGGNLLLNIGPAPDGSIPKEAKKPLDTVGKWLSVNGEALYNSGRPCGFPEVYGNGVSMCSQSRDGKDIYMWVTVWPGGGTMGYGGFFDAPEKITLSDGRELSFRHKGQRIILENLPESSPDPSGVTIIKMHFSAPPLFRRFSYYPQLTGGSDFSGGNIL